jgi:hypothetical protein
MLSVLVPTMPGRESVLSRCLYSVLEQPGLNRAFEVVVHKGDIPLGDKLNFMFDVALGSHVVVIDDDDWIAPHYMVCVLPRMKFCDAVGFDIGVLVDGRWEMRVEHRPTVMNWDGATTVRGFSHKTPVRTSMARSVSFGNDYTDDKKWASEVAPLISTSIYIPELLYWYDYRLNGSLDVGLWPYDASAVRWL